MLEDVRPACRRSTQEAARPHGGDDGRSRPGARRGGLHRRHDRSLRDPRAPPAVRSGGTHLRGGGGGRIRASREAAGGRSGSIPGWSSEAALTPKNIPARERLIFAMDVADPPTARRLVGPARRFRPLLQARARTVHVRRLLRAARLDGRARQEGVRRPEVLRRAGHGRRRGQAAAQSRRDARDGARQPGDHGSRRRRQGRREGARGHGAHEPRSRRPRRPRVRRATSSKLVLSRARRALEAGCDGVVSSGLEAPMLREFIDHAPAGRVPRHPPRREQAGGRPEAHGRRRAGVRERRRLHRRRPADPRRAAIRAQPPRRFSRRLPACSAEPAT